MNTSSIFKFIAEHQVLAVIIGIFLLGIVPGIVGFLREKLDFYIWYFVSILLVLVWAISTDNAETNHMLYFYAFILGMVTAFAEIIGKFSDEPIKSLRTPHALFYHLLNGAISAFALFVLKTYGMIPTNNQEKLQLVLIAGLGSMLVMRSKLFNLKIGGEDVAFGPEQIINVFFRFMESEIDRIRAQTRIDFVRERLFNVNFDKVHDYSVTMLRAAQALDTQERCKTAIQTLKAEQFGDPQMKSYALGFLLLNKMGENFVDKLFDKDKDKRPKEWALSAPMDVKEVKDETGILSRIPILNRAAKDAVEDGSTDEIYYMAYGSSMCGRALRMRLNWGIEETEFSKKTEPQRCVLKGYRLVFNKPDNPDEINPERVCGLPNIEPVADGTNEVEGALYKLTKAAIEFLDRTEVGYLRRTVDVFVGDQTFKAEVHYAETTRPDLKPEARNLQQVLDGAREHHLNEAYIGRLEALKAVAVEGGQPGDQTSGSSAGSAPASGHAMNLNDMDKAVMADALASQMTSTEGTTTTAS